MFSAKDERFSKVEHHAKDVWHKATKITKKMSEASS